MAFSDLYQSQSRLTLLSRFDWLPPMATRKQNVTIQLSLLRALCINFKWLLCICLSIAKSSHITGTRTQWVVPGIRQRRRTYFRHAIHIFSIQEASKSLN